MRLRLDNRGGRPGWPPPHPGLTFRAVFDDYRPASDEVRRRLWSSESAGVHCRVLIVGLLEQVPSSTASLVKRWNTYIATHPPFNSHSLWSNVRAWMNPQNWGQTCSIWPTHSGSSGAHAYVLHLMLSLTDTRNFKLGFMDDNDRCNIHYMMNLSCVWIMINEFDVCCISTYLDGSHKENTICSILLVAGKYNSTNGFAVTMFCACVQRIPTYNVSLMLSGVYHDTCNYVQ